jgi:adenylate cyclase
MTIEIERKFTVKNNRWREHVEHVEHIEQGYLADAFAIQSGATKCSVRVRIAGDQAWINIKSAETGISRQEYEYAIPAADARLMLDNLGSGAISKKRHHVRVDGVLFEVDEFLGTNAGLVVAEVELPSLDATHPVPDWLGDEVSDDGRYYNINLVKHPYSTWDQDQLIRN